MSALDVSLILLATTALALALFVVRLLRTPSTLALDWWLTSLAVAAVGALAWLAWPVGAGALAFAAFSALILLPSWLDARALREARRGELAQADRLARLAGLVHPFGLVRRRRRAIVALARLREGVPLDDEALRAVGAKDDPVLGEFYRLVAFDALGEPAALLDALAIPTRRARMLRLGLGAAWVRAAAERLDRPAVIDAIRTAEREDATLIDPDRMLAFLLEAQSAIGDVEGVDALAASLAGRVHPSDRLRARAFARVQAGDAQGARALLDEARAEPWGERPSLRRLGLQLLREGSRASTGRAPELEATRAHLREEAVAVHALSPLGGATKAKTPLTTATVLVLLGTFAFQASQGSTTDPAQLARLGALIAPLRGPSEAWRALTSAFLHAGLAHLLFNVASLVAFGRFVEHFFGRVGYVAIYLGAIAGSAGAVLATADPSAPKVLVGASGAIFGLFGAFLAAVGTRGELRRSRRGREQLRTFAGLVAAQLALEQLVPQIATSAHLGGLAAGALIGAALARSRKLAVPS